MINVDPGDFLIAPPKMIDSRFSNSVILITHHAASSLGFCINKSLSHTLSEIIAEYNLDIPIDPMIYWGGPVSQNTVWMIHDNSWSHPSSLKIDDTWNVISHATMFNDFCNDNIPEQFRIVMGCASWAPEQLNSELRGDPPWSSNHSWLVLKEPDPGLISNIDPTDLWKVSTDLSLKQSVSQLMS